MSILAGIENWVVDDMTPKQVRFVKAVLVSEADGLVGEVYQQIREDFQLVPPLTLFSPAEELLAGVWSMWRESQFVTGQVSRPIKEAIAATVSSTNSCPYCVDAHTGMLHASSDHDVVSGILHNDSAAIADKRIRDIVNWALETRNPGSKVLKHPPFNADEAPEIIGTALVYHFVNRMVNIFLVDTPMPVPASAKKLRSFASRIFGATVGKRITGRTPVAARSLRFVPNADVHDDLAWMSTNPDIATAFAGCIQIINTMAESRVPVEVQTIVNRKLEQWNGDDKGISRHWLEQSLENISHQYKPVARLCLLAAFAPYQVDENVIQDYRQVHPDDYSLLITTAWASMAATCAINMWVTRFMK